MTPFCGVRERPIEIDKASCEQLRSYTENKKVSQSISQSTLAGWLTTICSYKIETKVQSKKNTFKMSITELSTELLQKILEYSELQDLLHLAQTSKRTYRAYIGRRLPLLTHAMHNTYSPLPSLLKLTIANEPDKYTRRPLSTELRISLILNRMIGSTSTPLTLEMMKRMVPYGHLASRWTELYPRLRWRFASDNRRLLHSREKERLRGAVYHHWTYSTLFHSRNFTNYAPDPPSSLDDPRHRFLRTLSTVQHIALSEYLAHLETVVELDLYPSYSVILSQYPKSHTLPYKRLSKLGWGEGSEYRRLVRDILKLSPADLLHLYENTTTKNERFEYLGSQGVCFGNVPATMNYAISIVARERAMYRWGLDDSLGFSGGEIQMPSLMHQRVKLEEEDVPDEELIFGVVELKARGALKDLEDVVGNDAVETGEWETMRALYEGGFASASGTRQLASGEETEDED